MKLKIITLITLVSILLSACANADSLSLNGTSWQLVAIGKQQPISGSTITLTFEDGRVNGNSGCNSFGGEYQLKGDTVQFGMLMSTMMACADSAMMNQESTFMQFLGDAQRLEIVDGKLQIYRSDGDALTFVPR